MITQAKYESVLAHGKSKWVGDCGELLVVTTDTSVYSFFFHEGRLDLYRSFVVSHHEFIALQKTLFLMQGRADMMKFERTASVARTSAGVVNHQYGFKARKTLASGGPTLAPTGSVAEPVLVASKPAQASPASGIAPGSYPANRADPANQAPKEFDDEPLC